MYITPTQSGTPDGIEVASGDGSADNPWRFKLHYAGGFTVSFNNNGGSAQMSAVNGLNGEYTLPQSTMVAPSGYVFSGWKVNNTGDLLQPGTTITVTSDVTLYAQWTQQVYTLEVSNGTATFNGVTASTLTGLHYGDIVSITAAEPEPGQLFDQWNTYNGGTFGDRSQPTTTYTMPARNGSIWVRYKDAIETCKHHDGEIVCYAWDGSAPLPDTSGCYFLTKKAICTENIFITDYNVFDILLKCHVFPWLIIVEYSGLKYFPDLVKKGVWEYLSFDKVDF